MTNKPPRKTSTTASVRRCTDAIVADGGYRINGHIKRDAAQALSALLDAKYAGSRLAVISAALIDAAKKVARVQK